MIPGISPFDLLPDRQCIQHIIIYANQQSIVDQMCRAYEQCKIPKIWYHIKLGKWFECIMFGLFATRFPRCEYYSRFSIRERMTESQFWVTYHRSRFKRVVGERPLDFTFHPTRPGERITQASKTGTYLNPFHFPAYRQAVEPVDRPDTAEASAGEFYDELLLAQKTTAQYMVEQLRAKNLPVLVNADHEYSCVLVSFPKPEKAKPTDWTNLVIIHFIAICDYLSEVRALNSEIVWRSGFGHLRPTVCETAPSMRISPGIIPSCYADVIVDAVVATYQLLCGQESEAFNTPVQSSRLTEVLDCYNKVNKLTDKKLAVQPTLWDNFWFRYDSKGHAMMSQIMRHWINVEWIINQVLDQLRATEQPDFSSATQMRPLIAAAWLPIFERFATQPGARGRLTISLQKPTNPLPRYCWKQPAIEIIDIQFRELVIKIYGCFGATADAANPLTLDGLHESLELASVESFFHPDKCTVKDGYGSDSDDEASIPALRQTGRYQICTKKFITATGIRAIQLVFAAIKLYSQATTGLNFRTLEPDCAKMYYETETALSAKHAIPVTGASVTELAARYKVTFFDLNHCNNDQKPASTGLESLDIKYPICVLDTTSATIHETARACTTLFGKHESLDIIVCVGSGLKCEQGGSDLNPYGSIRIIARDKTLRDRFYNQLEALEAQAGYAHPALSHQLRLHAKKRGMTPTNHAILTAMSSMEDALTEDNYVLSNSV